MLKDDRGSSAASRGQIAGGHGATMRCPTSASYSPCFLSSIKSLARRPSSLFWTPSRQHCRVRTCPAQPRPAAVGATATSDTEESREAEAERASVEAATAAALEPMDMMDFLEQQSGSAWPFGDAGAGGPQFSSGRLTSGVAALMMC